MWAIIKQRFRQRQGFTLIELLIVIAIVGILSAGLLLTNVQTNLQRARDGKRATDLEAVRSALEIYRSENGGYPNISGSIDLSLDELQPDFITQLPVDPKSSTNSYYYAGLTGCAGNYCKTYELCAAFEKTVGSGSGACTAGSNLCGAQCNYRTQNP